MSVTIVLHNSEDHLPACLDSIRLDIADGRTELVAVDNASPDHSADIVAKTFPQASVIRSDENLGFAGGCNLAWPQTSGRYWLLLNPDVILEPRALPVLVQWMDDHPEVGAATPWLKDPATGELRYPGRAFPSVWVILLEMLRLHRLLPRRTRARLLQGPYVRPGHPAETPRYAGWIPATAMIVRREAVTDAGTLDDRFFLYGEDIEWCWRIRRAGWRIGVCPGPTAQHYESSSADRTWGAEKLAMVAGGFFNAARLARGERYARAYMAAQALAYWLLAIDPRLPRDARTQAQAWSRACRSAARLWRHGSQRRTSAA